MARNLFFYGTLRDAETRDIVMGEFAGGLDVRAGRLADHAVRAVDGEDYPVIVREAGSVAEGIVVVDLPEGAVDRLNYFEDEFDYALEEAVVETDAGPVTVELFYVRGDHLRIGGPWDYAAWQAAQQAAFAECARGLMALYGQVPAEEVERIWPGIRFRAYARARARAERPVICHRSGLTRDDVRVEAASEPYVDYYAVEAYRLSHRRFDGGWEGPMDRAVLVSGDAVAALPYDPVRDTVLVLEQFRPSLFARGDAVPWALEPVAGRIDRVESDEATARREMREEAGLEAGRLDRLAPFYSSPGTVTERLSCFIAEADLRLAGGLHGLEDEAEDIRTLVLPFGEVAELLASGEVENGPLHLLLLHLTVHRDRLRAAWG